METNRIRQFRVVVETGNLRKAAELLGISHSGLSKSLKALEAELGVELLQPSGRGIVISDHGRRFYERSARFMEEFEAMIGPASAGAPDTLRFGSFETFTSFFVGPLIAQHLPGMRVEIHELLPGRLEEALLSGRVDVGVTYEPIPRKGVEYVRAASLTMGAYALAGRFEHVELSRVPFLTQASPLDGAPSGAKGLDGWPEDKFPRDVRYRVDLLATGLELARQGLAAIFLPRFVARLSNERCRAELQLAPLKLPRALAHLKRDVFIVKRESTPETDVVRRIARALRDACD